MKRPEDLTRRELETIVQHVQDALWYSTLEWEEPKWDKDKEWDCPNDLADIANILRNFDLEPK